MKSQKKKNSPKGGGKRGEREQRTHGTNRKHQEMINQNLALRY
jgi:hypothetical protein